jgi:hypothetical protein
MRIHQSSRKCISKRLERFTFSLGDKAGMSGLKTFILASLRVVTVFLKTLAVRLEGPVA